MKLNSFFLKPTIFNLMLLATFSILMDHTAFSQKPALTDTLIHEQDNSPYTVTALGIEKEKKQLTYSAQHVSVKSLVPARDLNLANSLSGKVAGLDIVRSNSGVGSSTRLVLRGNRSISGNNQPLYVVDGVPVNNSSASPDDEFGGIALGDGIGNINPEDIADITVLKGPSASALYGTRGNNGVIMITTKKGNAGKGIDLTYSFQYGAETPLILSRLQHINGQGSSGIYSPNSEFGWGPKMEGQAVAHWTPDINSPKYGTTYPFTAHPDNVKDFLRTGSNLTHSLSMTAGKENIQAYLSYTNVMSKGIMPGNDLQRNNFNLRTEIKLLKNLIFDAKITYFWQEVRNRVSTGDDFKNPMRALLRQPGNIANEEAKNYSYYDNQGFQLQNYWNPHYGGGENPYWLINMIPSLDTHDRVLLMGSLKYKFMEGLSLMVRTGGDIIHDHFTQSLHNDTYNVADRGNYLVGAGNNREINLDILLDYDRTIGDNWSIRASLGGNVYNQKFYGKSTDNTELLKPNLFTVSNAFRLTSDEYGGNRKLSSLYGFTTLGFKKYLFLDLTARNDWSSDKPVSGKSSLYSSAGLSWIVSEMVSNFPEWITFAKIRTSVARAGIDNDQYRIYAKLNTDLTNYGTYSVKPNPDLKPEMTTSEELGLDVRFLQNRIGIDLTWYKSASKNQILKIPLNIATGYNFEFINGGLIQNSGVEAILSITPVQGALTWDIVMNFARNKNRVMELSSGLSEYTMRSRSWMTTIKAVTGHEMGDIYTSGFERNSTGQIEIDGNGLPLTTGGQTVLMGNYNPHWIGGIQNSFSWKGFDMSVTIDIRQGGDIFSYTEAILAGDGFSDYTLKGRDGMVVPGVLASDGHTPNNIQTTAEEYWQSLGGRITPTGEAFKYDASNVRLREFVIGYTKTVQGSAVKSVRISVAGKNLLFLSNKAKILDPGLSVGITNSQGVEGFGLPPTRSYGVNLSVMF